MRKLSTYGILFAVFSHVRLYDGVIKENQFPRITKSELEQYNLVISVWHKDLLTQNAPIGEAAINLRDHEWDPACPAWYQLEGKTEVPPDPCPWKMGSASVHIRLTFSLWDRERRIGPLSLLLRDVRFSEMPPQILAHRHATLVASA
ncbi:hypothetical protein ANCCAN_18779 [Ancylostoma caninum]|uniref:C2 domain-containing protein n=1 Tax=Ancylostoma caninum TaxID=29170 RepID=A0A368FTE7_ANCCA|nr:hypothetical protein ANCCAN_18779 [Ancylostoma caninum]